MSTIVRLVNGGTIAVREGILRGVGPMGPEGPQGPIGETTTLRGTVADSGSLPAFGTHADAYVAEDTGHIWVWNADLVPARWIDGGRFRGEKGDLQSPGAKLTNTTHPDVAGTSWQILEVGDFTYNDTQSLPGGDLDLLTKVNATEFAVNHPTTGETGAYQFTVEVEIETQAGSTAGWRTVGLYRNGTLFMRNAVYDPGVDNTPIYLSLTTQAQTKSTDRWTARLLANDTAQVSVDTVEVTVSRLGGGIGPTGPVGPQGPQGIQGIQGPQGAAQDGFGSFDEITGGGRDSTTDPGGTPDSTTEQDFPIPGSDQRPHIPFFLRRLAETLEHYVVARLDTFAELNTRADSDPGELMYNNGNGETHERGLYLRTDLGGDAVRVPLVRYGTTAPATSTTDPNGTIYLVHEA